MFERIMVPLDGSDLAERALACAERLADATQATLHLVRVVEPPTPLTRSGLYAPLNVYDDLISAERREAQAYLERVRARLEARGVREERLRLEQREGDAAVTLLDYEREAGIDLVVMCSHGRSGVARFALGSVAERLLRHGAAPVLLVRAYGPPITLSHVVLPLDGSPLADAALDTTAQLSRAVVQEITLLRVISAPVEGPEAERSLEQAAHRLQRLGLVRGGEAGCHCVVRQGEPAQTIIDTAGTDGLVIMATHGRSAVTRWAHGSMADRVVRGGVAGVLLVRARAVPTQEGASNR